jgi:hypothetical protein
MPNSSSNGLHRCNGTRCCCRGNRSLKFHARLQVMNAELLSIDSDPGTVRNIGKMSDSAVFHLHH